MHGHITLEGIVVEQGLLDGEKYKSNWIARVHEDNKYKETRGLYRRMLLDANLYESNKEADEHCPVGLCPD